MGGVGTGGVRCGGVANNALFQLLHGRDSMLMMGGGGVTENVLFQLLH